MQKKYYLLKKSIAFHAIPGNPECRRPRKREMYHEISARPEEGWEHVLQIGKRTGELLLRKKMCVIRSVKYKQNKNDNIPKSKAQEIR